MSRAVKLQDPALVLLATVATILGLFLIFDAGYPRSFAAGRGVVPSEFRSQLITLPVALLLGWWASRSNPAALRKAAKPAWILGLAALVLVKFRGIEMNGAQRWLKLGPVTVQPAEFVKLATVLYLAAVLADRPAWPASVPPRRSLVHWLDTIAVPKLLRALPALWVLVAVFLIEKEPDLGTGAIVAFAAGAMFLPGGVSRKSLVAVLVIGLLGAGFLAKQEPYRMQRILSHSQRWDAKNVDNMTYQTVQSEIAQASGGLLGVGIGAGRAKQVLPATTTDFIGATIGEEFGLWGSLLVLGALGAIVWRLLWLAGRATNRFSMLVLFGVAAWIGVQSCVNFMMANALLPAIGVPLPFVSSGGSSLVALWLAVGVAQAALAPAPERAPAKRAAVVARGGRALRA